jgi:hypothetical protein
VGRPTALRQASTAEPGRAIAPNRYEPTREAAMAAFAKLAAAIGPRCHWRGR